VAGCGARSRVERQPLKKFDAQEEMLLKLFASLALRSRQDWAQHQRIVVAFEAGATGSG